MKKIRVRNSIKTRGSTISQFYLRWVNNGLLFRLLDHLSRMDSILSVGWRAKGESSEDLKIQIRGRIETVAVLLSILNFTCNSKTKSFLYDPPPRQTTTFYGPELQHVTNSTLPVSVSAPPLARLHIQSHILASPPPPAHTCPTEGAWISVTTSSSVFIVTAPTSKAGVERMQINTHKMEKDR